MKLTGETILTALTKILNSFLSGQKNRIMKIKFEIFKKKFKYGKMVFVEDSVLWYCLDMNTKDYLAMNINQRINFKQSYFK